LGDIHIGVDCAYQLYLEIVGSYLKAGGGGMNGTMEKLKGWLFCEGEYAYLYWVYWGTAKKKVK
jgi:hypothetical protein